MANSSLFLSTEGLSSIKEDEGVINGLYDDPSGYCTSGVGHLVHTADKWKCFLLAAASDADTWKKLVEKKWPGKSYETPYLLRAAKFKEKFDDLKTSAITLAKTEIAQSKYKKAFDSLTKPEQQAVKTLAESAIDEEAKILAKTTDDLLKQDVKPFEKAVRTGVTGVELVQKEFDALVSFAFNVGAKNFNNSTLLKKINANKYRTGEAKSRKQAIDEIEKEFLKWNKSGGKVLTGLTKRRQSEADRFLKKAREELKQLDKKDSVATPKPKP